MNAAARAAFAIMAFATSTAGVPLFARLAGAGPDDAGPLALIGAMLGVVLAIIVLSAFDDDTPEGPL